MTVAHLLHVQYELPRIPIVDVHHRIDVSNVVIDVPPSWGDRRRRRRRLHWRDSLPGSLDFPRFARRDGDW